MTENKIYRKLPTLYTVDGVKKVDLCSVSVTLVLLENMCSESRFVKGLSVRKKGVCCGSLFPLLRKWSKWWAGRETCSQLFWVRLPESYCNKAYGNIASCKILSNHVSAVTTYKTRSRRKRSAMKNLSSNTQWFQQDEATAYIASESLQLLHKYF